MTENDRENGMSGSSEVEKREGAGLDVVSGDLYARFCAARDSRRSGGIEREMVEDMRRRDGEYEPSVLAALEAQGGSKAFDNVTDVKCSGIESFFADLFYFYGQRPIGLEATPIPELDRRAMEEAIEEAMVLAENAQLDPNDPDAEEKLSSLALTIKDRIKDEIVERAKSSAKAMENLIWDQLVEGGFMEALNVFISDIATHKIGALMGPVPTMKTIYTGGEWVEKLVLATVRVNPLNIYPASNSLKPVDGDFFVREVITDDMAWELFRLPGVNRERLEEAIKRGGGEREPIDIELESYATRGGSTGSKKPDNEHVLIRWWHRMTKNELKTWRGEEGEESEGEENEENEYKKIPYYGLMLNGTIIKAVENLDKCGTPNVFVGSFRERPGSFWGIGGSGLCKETQESANVIKRATMNNIHMASMNSYQADKAALVHPDSMKKQFPGQVILTKQMMGDNRDPVKVISTENHTNILLQARSQIVMALDDKTGIYPQSYGNPQQVGPAETLGGYQMLRQDQTKSMKRALKNVSDVVAELVKAYWQWNMMFSKDESIKGDIQVVTSGAVQMYLTADEVQKTLSAIQILERSPAAAQFIKPDGMAHLYRTILKMHKIDPNMVFKSEKEIAEIMAQAKEAEAQAIAKQLEGGEEGSGEPQMMPDKPSSMMKAQADMIKAQATEKRVALDEKRVKIQQAGEIARIRKMMHDMNKKATESQAEQQQQIV